MSELYYPEETSTGYVVTGIAEGIAQHFDVGVICAQPTYAARGQKAPRYETRNGTHIHRVSSTRLDKNMSFYRLLNAITISAMAFVRGLRSVGPGDVVIAVTNPPTLPYMAAIVCKLKRAGLIVLVHDIYPDVLIAADVVGTDSKSARLIDRVIRWTYRKADRVVVLGRDMRSRVQEALDQDRTDRVVVITNWADTDRIHHRPRQGSELLDKLGLSDKFVVQFAGNIGVLQNVPFLLDAAQSVQSDPRVAFLFVGEGSERAWLESEIKSRRLSNVVVRDWVARDGAAEMHRASDAVVISLVPRMRGVSVPSRLYNALASGRPVIALCDAESEVALVVREERVGWLVEPGDLPGFRNAINEALADAGLVGEMGIRARRVAEEKYSEPRIVGQFLELVAEVGQECGSSRGDK